MTEIALLPDRAVLELAGPDRVAFLQGLVSNDVARAEPGRAVWTALLTPQGKYLADFFILADGERLLLDLQAGHRDKVAETLARYRLRSRVTLTPLEIPVHAAWSGSPEPSGAIAAPDPRLPDAGWRLLGGSPRVTATPEGYDMHRLGLGLPNGEPDLEPERSTLLEAGFDELGGVDWQKGCYMGQELTARTKYRGLVKRRLTPVRLEGPLLPPGCAIHDGEVEVGTIRSGRGDRALATLRLDSLRAPRLRCGETSVVPAPASWMRWEPVRLATG